MYSQNTSNELNSSRYSNSIELPEVGDESISSLKFINSTGCLAAGTWGGEIRVWKISGSNAVPFSCIKNQGAILSLCEQPNSPVLISTCSDGSIKMHDLQSQNSNNFRLIKQESSVVSCCVFSSTLNVLITGNWAGELNFWDLRQQNPVHSHKASGRISTLAISSTYLGYGLNTREIYILNLKQSNLNAFSRLPIPDVTHSSNSITSQTGTASNTCLNYSIQDLAIMKDDSALIAAQSSGDVTVIPLQNQSAMSGFGTSNNTQKGMVLALHEKGTPSYYGKKDLLPTNAISIHNTNGVFTTGGGDGRVNFVNKDEKRKMFTLESPIRTPTRSIYSSNDNNLAVVSTDFDASCKYFAKAYSYDWYKGKKGYNKDNMKPKIFINYAN